MDLLVDPSLQRSGRILMAMARAVTQKDDRNPDVGLIDAGPYDFEDEIRWADVAQTDLISFLMQVRAAKESTFTFDTQCEGCRTKLSVDVKAEDLDLGAPMPEAGILHLQTKEPFNDVLPCSSGEAKVRLRLLRASDMPRIAKAQRQMSLTEAFRYQQALHVLRLDAPDLSEPLTETDAVLDWISNEDAETLISLQEAVIKREGEPVTEVEVICNHCGTENFATIPFVVQFFLTTRQHRRSSSARSRI